MTTRTRRRAPDLSHIAEELRPLAVPIADLTPDPKNARLHDDINVKAIASSLATFGQVKPIVILEDGTIIAGNGTTEAAQTLGWTHVAAVTFDDEAKARAFALADNRTAELAQWDIAILERQVAELSELEFDVGSIGLSDADLESIRLSLTDEAPAAPQEITEDAPPAAPKKARTKPGDLWILGEHRLLCGDATNPEDVAKLLDGREPFLMVTDPPYGVNYDPRWRLEAGVNKPHQKRAEGKVANDDNASWKAAWDLFPGVVAYVWHGALHASTVAIDLAASGFEIRSQIIWVKPSLVIGRGAYHWRHEPCWYASRGTAKWAGDRKQSTAWEIANMHRTQGKVDDGRTEHGTQKPVECMARPIRNHGGPEDDVYEPFAGSGTTLIAAEQLGRRCLAMEIEPAYCDITVKRWEDLTGRKAERIR